MKVKTTIRIIITAFTVGNLSFLSHADNDSGHDKLYLDSNQPIRLRVENLLNQMTLKEKLGQMNIPTVYKFRAGSDVSEKLELCKRFTEGTLVSAIGPGGGLFRLANNVLKEGPLQQAEFNNQLQRIATQKTRLGIPLMQVEEGTHGLMCAGATIFPEGPGLGSTFHTDLIRKVYAAAAKEGRAIGAHMLCTLVIEPVRDPRLGRNEETFSEDPYLTAQIAEAIVKGAQGRTVAANDKLIAVLCHFPGQSQPVGGLERAPMEISERTLRDIFMPAWLSGIKKAGALGVMATYPSIDSISVHRSERILTDLLREELGFQGCVLSEGGGIGTLITDNVAKDWNEAGRLALQAGVDIAISLEPAYMDALMEGVKNGRVSRVLVDRAVRRILRTKFRLGLFENPYVKPDRAVKLVHSMKHQELALKAAREGIVLLKNKGNILPLDRKTKTIAVIGPNADNGRNQLGDYFSSTVLQDIVTVLEGIKSKVTDDCRLKYVKGCNVFTIELNKINEACEAASAADVAVVVVGENERGAKDQKGRNVGTNGEARDVASLDLTGLQSELVRAIVGTGTPTVVVLINGRPLSIRWIADNVPAVVEAWLPGEKGGRAVADVLFGDYNPGGKLPVSIPRHVGQLPVYYNYKPPRRSYVDMPSEPLYEFGYGLSYTQFEYGNLKISPKPPAGLIGPASQVLVSADIENTGDFTGDEVVQLYINDRISSVTTPLKELKGFERITLQPGEKRTVEFTLTPYELSLLDRNMERVVEPGVFEVMVGSSSKNIRLKGTFEVQP